MPGGNVLLAVRVGQRLWGGLALIPVFPERLINAFGGVEMVA
jgi:hypothetical protein